MPSPVRCALIWLPSTDGVDHSRDDGRDSRMIDTAHPNGHGCDSSRADDLVEEDGEEGTTTLEFAGPGRRLDPFEPALPGSARPEPLHQHWHRSLDHDQQVRAGARVLLREFDDAIHVAGS